MINNIDISVAVVSGRKLATTLRTSDVKQLSVIKGRPILNGSLNLISKSPIWLDIESSLYTNENKNHYYWDAFLEGIPVVVNRWSCPAHIFEIFSEYHLRTKLNLKDGDNVTLSIPIKMLHLEANSQRRNSLMWHVLWYGREQLFYKSDRYLAFTEKLGSYIWRSNQIF